MIPKKGAIKAMLALKEKAQLNSCRLADESHQGAYWKVAIRQIFGGPIFFGRIQGFMTNSILGACFSIFVPTVYEQ